MNNYAGVVLDWYDDKGETLKALFPTPDKLPEIIKTANVQPPETLQPEDFALVAVNEGHVLHKFACHDAGTTAMSVVYFMEHGDKLPEEAQKLAAANLVNACESFDLQPPDAILKVAGTSKGLKNLADRLSYTPYEKLTKAQKYIHHRMAAANLGKDRELLSLIHI